MQSEETKRAGQFVLGSRVTVCADEACTRVMRFGTVKRIGNEGASWRLGGTCEWYEALTGRRIGNFDDPYFARPYREGDEALQGAEKARREAMQRARALVVRAQRDLGYAASDRSGCERSVSRAKDDVVTAERQVGYARGRLSSETARLEELWAKERACDAALRRAQAEEALVHG